MKFVTVFCKEVKRCIAATIIFSLSLSGCGGGGGGSSVGTGKQIEKLTLSKQADGTNYYTGTYQGAVVRFTHSGVPGQGTWAIYSGKPGDRIRVTVSDTGGIQEVLSMDKGHRTTVNYVGSERIEYRIYSSDGKFVLGSVLYILGDMWMQGLMFTEAFSGYNNLVSVTDVTPQITKANSDLSTMVALVQQPNKMKGLEIISSAYADMNDLMEFAHNTWGQNQSAGYAGLITISGIITATLGPAATGAAIVTASDIVVAGAVTVLTAAAALATAPIIVAVTVGCVIGTLASNSRSQTHSVETATTPLITADYNTTVSPTNFTTAPSSKVPSVISLDGDRCLLAKNVAYGVIHNNVCIAEAIITSVEPKVATVGLKTNLIVRGSNLGGLNGLRVSMDDCPNMVTEGGTDSSKTYSCSPLSEGTKTIHVSGAEVTTNMNYLFSISVSAAPAGIPVVSSISPTSGTVGTAVTITGANFSDTPASNTVKFNGTLATVTGATATSLAVTVPVGATNGTISVTTAGGPGTSTGSFTVTSSAATTPTVTGMSPTSGAVGTVMTITGTNFSTTPASNTVKFNGSTAVVSASTASSITIAVPAGATTGTVSVTTASGTGTSTGIFTINQPIAGALFGNWELRNGSSLVWLKSFTGGPTTGQIISTQYNYYVDKKPNSQGVSNFKIISSSIDSRGITKITLTNSYVSSEYCKITTWNSRLSNWNRLMLSDPTLDTTSVFTLYAYVSSDGSTLTFLDTIYTRSAVTQPTLPEGVACTLD